jgi:hypothetical protein
MYTTSAYRAYTTVLYMQKACRVSFSWLPISVLPIGLKRKFLFLQFCVNLFSFSQNYLNETWRKIAEIFANIFASIFVKMQNLLFSQHILLF